MLPPDPLHLSLTELVDALAARQLSPVALMTAVLDRADATHEMLNALVARRPREELLAEAEQAEARIAAGDGGLLEGVPLAVKDLEDVAGLVTSHGSVPLRDAVAEQDSVQVARLREAGAIVIGKTNAPEFGYTAVTKNRVYGVTRSPWNPERSPGGSSGGSAALIAAEVVPLVTASDGGGSIRIPSAMSGTFGLKPSFGRVPKGPSTFWDYGTTAVYGPLTKTVSDAALVLDVIAGHHPLDARSLPKVSYRYRERAEQPLDRKLHIALSTDLGYAVVQSDVARVVEEAAKVFEQLGHRVSLIDGGPPEMGTDWGLLGAYELRAEISHLLPEHAADISRALMSVMQMAEGIEPAWWAATSRKRANTVRWCAELFDRYDALITPTVPYDPPPARGPLPPHTEGRPQPPASAGSFTIPFNLSWHPAVSVRAGLSDAGLPVGMQIVAPHHRDDMALQLARTFERERPWHPHWPLRQR